MEDTLQFILGELKGIHQYMDKMDNRMGTIENHMDAMENHMTSIEGRMGMMEQNLADLGDQVKENTMFIHALVNGQHKLEQKLDYTLDQVQNLAKRTSTL